MPVTGPANVHQTGSQPACRTRHLVLPLAARSDSGRSSVRDTLLVVSVSAICPPLLMHRNSQIFFPCNVATQISYQVKPPSLIPDSRPPSNYAFSQPISPKSPLNFMQYHRCHQPEYPPLEVDSKSQHAASRSRTRKGRNFRSLDFEVGIWEDTSSNYSAVLPYHQYLEGDQWEACSSGK